MAVVAWMVGDPFFDPTPLVYPFRKYLPDGYVIPDPINTLHVAILKANPPARMAVKLYWCGDAKQAVARLAAFDRQLRAGAPIYFKDHKDNYSVRPVPWHLAFWDQARHSDMTMAILQAVLCGDRIPDGVMVELVRLHRKKLPSEPHAAAVLHAWAVGKGLARAVNV